MGYLEAAEIQRQTLESVVRGAMPSTLFFVEHEPVLTLGANFHEDNLLLPRDQYPRLGIDILLTDRGGDVTYHGPGQLVIYPVFDLARFGKDLHKWLRKLEEVVIQAVKELGIAGYRFPPHTGVWVNEAKVAAIGIKVRRWVSMHGIALNCGNDLRGFDTIFPCGIQDYGVTSLTKELGEEITIERMKPLVKEAFEEVLRVRFEEG